MNYNTIIKNSSFLKENQLAYYKLVSTSEWYCRHRTHIDCRSCNLTTGRGTYKMTT